jgi:DNA polymerase
MLDERRKRYLAAMGVPVYRRRGRTAVGTPDERCEDTAPVAAGLQGSVDGVADRHTATVSGVDSAEVVEVVRAGQTSEPESDWPELKRQVATCTACALHESRNNAVFGVGREDADLMVIGEAPGADEDRQGEPFVGKAGQLLTAMLKAIGLAREDVYIANILKCRPAGNRNPSPAEINCCLPFLMRQIGLIRPRLILSVGGVSAHNLLGTEESVGRLRGTVHRFGEDSVPLVVSYHPAYLLRKPAEKSKAWQDLQKVREMLNSD